jgi:hypothetical protein
LRLIAGGALIDPADVAAELDGLDPARRGLLAALALKASQLLLAEQDHQIVVLELQAVEADHRHLLTDTKEAADLGRLAIGRATPDWEAHTSFPQTQQVRIRS